MPGVTLVVFEVIGSVGTMVSVQWYMGPCETVGTYVCVFFCVCGWIVVVCYRVRMSHVILHVLTTYQVVLDGRPTLCWVAEGP